MLPIRLITADRRFAPYFWTQFLGALNDNFLKTSLAVIIIYQGVRLGPLDSSLTVALSAGLFILPFFLFSATAGQLADRFEKSRLIRLAKYLELLLMVGAALAFWVGNLALLLVLLFWMGAQSSLFGPLKYGILPDLVDESRLVTGNAYVETGTFVAILIGTIAGGIVPALPHGTLVMIIGLPAVALGGIACSHLVPRVPVHSRELRVDWTLLRPTWQILRAVRSDTPTFNSILGISWFWFLGAGLLTLLPTFTKGTLEAGEQVMTAFLAVFTVGIGLGSIACERMSFRRVEIGLVPIGSLGMSLFLADLYWTGTHWDPFASERGLLTLREFMAQPNGPRILVDLLLVALMGALFIVPLYSFIQQRSEPAFIARTISANNILNALFMVGSAAAIMVLHAAGFTVPQIFLVYAVVNVLVAVYIYSLVPEFTLRFLSWVLVHVMYRLRVIGEENLPVRGPMVLLCNHVTYVDWLMIFGACRRPVRFVMDHRLSRMPLVKYLMRHAKVVPIAPAKESVEVMERAFATVSDELRRRQVVVIFPEGKLTRSGAMNPFRPGIERIPRSDPVPVVPMALYGLWGSIFSWAEGRVLRKWPVVWRRRIVLHVGGALPPEQAGAAALEQRVSGLLVEAEQEWRALTAPS